MTKRYKNVSCVTMKREIFISIGSEICDTFRASRAALPSHSRHGYHSLTIWSALSTLPLLHTIPRTVSLLYIPCKYTTLEQRRFFPLPSSHSLLRAQLLSLALQSVPHVFAALEILKTCIVN